MLFKTSVGKEIKFNPPYKDYPLKCQEDCKSGKQYLLGRYLSKIFGPENILEDCPLPQEKNLSWDFWVPKFNIAFEYDGEQHDKFNSFYHKDKSAFVKQKNNDGTKEKIATINDIKLVRITYKDNLTENLLRKLILGV